MQPPHASRENRADFLGAEGDDQIDPGRVDFVDRFGAMSRYVDADLGHGLDGIRIDLGRVRAGAHDIDVLAKDAASQALRHLAAGGVGDAEEQDARSWRDPPPPDRRVRGPDPRVRGGCGARHRRARTSPCSY